jgi:hypothetical protein
MLFLREESKLAREQKTSASSFPVTTRRVYLETGASTQHHCEPRDSLFLIGPSTSPRGQALNPIQDGFHFVNREWPAIPFMTGTKNPEMLS